MDSACVMTLSQFSVMPESLSTLEWMDGVYKILYRRLDGSTAAVFIPAISEENALFSFRGTYDGRVIAIEKIG